MSQFQYHQFLYGSDNYGVLMHDAETSQTAAIDAGDLDSYLAALEQTGWSLSHILVTHHHGDHTEGLAQLAAQTGAKVFGPAGDQPGHQAIETKLADGDRFEFAGTPVEVIATPGHTLDMLNYYLPDQAVFNRLMTRLIACRAINSRARLRGQHRQPFSMITMMMGHQNMRQGPAGLIQSRQIAVQIASINRRGLTGFRIMHQNPVIVRAI